MTKKLGFGLMRLPLTDPDDRGSIDIPQMCEMVDKFLERGFTYFDTAWMYCDGKSENAVKEALVSRHERGSFTLTTKLHAGYIKTEEDRERIFSEQLRKTGAGYFDYYFLHALNEKNLKVYEELHCFDFIRQKKEEGLVRHIGFSFHDTPELLDRVLTEHPEIEVVQIQLNYLDWNNPGILSGACYEVAAKHGKPVIVMEPVKGGTLAKLPAQAEALMKSYAPDASLPSWAIRFAASLDNVMMVLSGMSNLEQVLDNTDTMAELKPLCAEEKEILAQVVDIINDSIAIPCTGCAYCTDGCPMNIAIPKYFALFNNALQESAGNDWTPHREYYENYAQTNGKASECIGCGHCESVCPQKLPIRKHLRRVARKFEA